MKSAEQRDAMVEQVNATAAKWPTLGKVPVGSKLSEGAKTVVVKVRAQNGQSNSHYVAALYSLCEKGAVPIGRSEIADDGSAELIGEIV